MSLSVPVAALPMLRAAYSDRTAARMATLAAFAYDNPENAGSVDSIPGALAQLGFTTLTWFKGFGWAFLAESPDLAVVAFRGSRSIKDWETNFNVEMDHPPRTDAKLRIHRGFLQAFTRLNEGSDGIAAKILTIDRTKPIYFCGHSLGGALAQIATAILGSDQVAACYTFGSPRVGNAIFDLWVKPPCYRVLNYADIVPLVPVFAPPFFLYHHAGDIRYLPSENLGSPYRYAPGLGARMMQIGLGLLKFLRSGTILGLADHGIEHYQDKLAAIADARKQTRDRPDVAYFQAAASRFTRN